jgi:hypothetical protein
MEIWKHYKILRKKIVPLFVDIEILYSAATILLDLSANDIYIEKIGEHMLQFGMFKYVI